MIVFNNWNLMETGGALAYQYDNLTRTLLVTGDLPDGWTWDMLVSVGDNLDIIRLSPMEGGVGVVLTAEMLALSGHYTMQLRGTLDEQVRHTNKIVVFIPPSLSGDANWPEIPSEFTQMEQRINEAVEHYPQIGENCNWMSYDVDSGEWVDTGVSAAGQKGGPGEPGPTPNLTIGTVETLEAGSDATASITGTAKDPVLNLGIPRGEGGTASVQSDWNVNDETDLAYVKNRPCYEETTEEVNIIWDGDTEGLPTNTDVYYKVSAKLFTTEELSDAVVTFDDGSTMNASELGVHCSNNVIYMRLSDIAIVLSTDNRGVSGGIPYAFSETGTWFHKSVRSLLVPSRSVIHTLDEKFLSEDITILPDEVDALQESVSALQADAIALTDQQIDLIWNPPPCLTFSSPEEFSVSFSTPYWDGTIEYSPDKQTWNVWSGSSIIAVPNTREYVLYFRGAGNTRLCHVGFYGDIDSKWVLAGENISCAGNIEVLLDYETVAAGEHPVMADSCYYGMFYKCTGLVEAPELPATTLASSCYNSMFYGCTGLTTAPELPVTTLAGSCYSNMFYGCTGLTTAPELPATTLMFNCYMRMFSGCTALTTVPKLPATTLVSSCYNNMFNSCANIKLSKNQTDEYTQEYRIPTSGTGTTVAGAMTGILNSTGGTFTGTPEINTTYYLHKDCTIV